VKWQIRGILNKIKKDLLVLNKLIFAESVGSEKTCVGRVSGVVERKE